MHHVVLVEFRAKPDRLADFEALVDRHAAISRAEDGCLVFDACQVPDDPHHFVFYEVYVDAAAHAAHRETPHFARWSREIPALVEMQGDTPFVSRRVLKRRAEVAAQ